MKKLFASFVFAVVCLASSSVFAQEVPVAAEEADDGQNVSADALVDQPVILKCDKNGVCVWAPVKVEVNVPEQPAPEVIVENSIDFPSVMKTRDVGKSACGRSPGWCAFGVGVGVVAVIALGAYAADQAGMFDTTNNVGFER